MFSAATAAPAAPATGGVLSQDRLVWRCCPQRFVHSYPQIAVDNYRISTNVSVNLWISLRRLNIMNVVQIQSLSVSACVFIVLRLRSASSARLPKSMLTSGCCLSLNSSDSFDANQRRVSTRSLATCAS